MIHEFRIVDAEAHKNFEELLGFKIHSDRVSLPHDVYERHARAIQAIQMAAAWRIKGE